MSSVIRRTEPPHWSPEFFYTLNLFQPNPIKLVEALQVALQNYFSEVKVRWANCPDLREEPFEFFARGLCGNTAIVQIGGSSELFPAPQESPKVEISDIDSIINDNMCNRFIIGGCAYPRPTNEKLAVLTTNMLLAPISKRMMTVKYKTNLMFDEGAGIITEPLNNYNFPCGIMGNYFLSEGKPGHVLEILAKKSLTDLTLPSAMHAVIYGDPYEIFEKKVFGLGATYMMNNGIAQCHLLPDSWDPPYLTQEDIMSRTFSYTMASPVLGFGTLLNCLTVGAHTEVPLMPRNCYGFSYPNMKGGFHFVNCDREDDVEYLGYFSIAKTLYRINPKEQWYPAQE